MIYVHKRIVKLFRRGEFMTIKQPPSLPASDLQCSCGWLFPLSIEPITFPDGKRILSAAAKLICPVCETGHAFYGMEETLQHPGMSQRQRDAAIEHGRGGKE
jgi:hypothetical protein